MDEGSQGKKPALVMSSSERQSVEKQKITNARVIVILAGLWVSLHLGRLHRKEGGQGNADSKNHRPVDYLLPLVGANNCLRGNRNKATNRTISNGRWHDVGHHHEHSRRRVWRIQSRCLDCLDLRYGLLYLVATFRTFNRHLRTTKRSHCGVRPILHRHPFLRPFQVCRHPGHVSHRPCRLRPWRRLTHCHYISVKSDIIPLKERSLIKGIGNVAFGAVNALGGYYGGGISDAIGWQWSFLVQVPVIRLEVITVLLFLRLPPQSTGQHESRKSRSVDYIGCLCVLLVMVLFQLALNDGSNLTSWNSPVFISSFIIAGMAFVFLLWGDMARAKHAVLPFLHLLKRTIAASQVLYFFNSIAVYAIIYYIPIYLEFVKGQSASDGGLHFIPYSPAFGVSSFVTGLLVKRLGRYYHVNLFIQASCLAGTAGLVTMNGSTAAGNPYGFLVLLGVGYGGAMVTRLMGLLSTADKKNQAVVQGASWTINSTGNSVRIAIASSIFRNLYVGPLTATLSGRHKDILTSLLRGSSSAVNLLPDDVQTAVTGIYLHAVRSTFWMALVAAILSSGSSLIMEDNRIE